MASIMTLPVDGSDWGSMNPDFSFSSNPNSPLRGIHCGKRKEYPLDELDMVYSPDKPEDIHTMHFELTTIEDEDDDFAHDPVLSAINTNLSIFPKSLVTDPEGEQHYVYKCYSFSRPIYYIITGDIVTVTRNIPKFPCGSIHSDFDISLLLDHRPRFVEATYLLSFSPVDTMLIFGGRYDVVGKFFHYSEHFWQSVKDHLIDITEEAERLQIAENRLFSFTELLPNMV